MTTPELRALVLASASLHRATVELFRLLPDRMRTKELAEKATRLADALERAAVESPALVGE